MPWTNTGRVPPPLQMESWTTSHDDPLSNYTVHQRPSTQRKPDLDQVVEIDSGMLPNEFFARSPIPVLSVTTSPVNILGNSQSRSPNQHGGSISSRRRQSFGITTPTTPSTATLTTATTFAGEMSRESSFGNDAMIGGFEMMNMHSNTSFLTDNSADERLYLSGIPFSTSPSYSKLSSSEEQSLLLAGAGGASHDPQYSLSFQDSGESDAQYFVVPPFPGDMKRSESNESNISVSSCKSRATTRLKHQNQLAARPLAPKAGADDNTVSRQGSHTMVSLKSKDGSEERVVAQISKTPYQRPKHARVYCDLCKEYPEGFRGPHELGRHEDRQHKEQVKKWVCIEPADGIVNSQFQPVNPMSKCKACSQHKKKYGAYYNAAAHLRRAHFKPKARGRSKCTKVEDKSEKRGGKAGGDWPPMFELKRWMKEVEEHVSESQQQEVDEEEDDDDCNGDLDFEEDYMKSQSITSTSAGSSNFDSSLACDDATMIDAYPTPTSNYASQSTQNVQYDLPLTHSIDLAMQVDSSQSSFINSQYASMNDPMAFIDPFTQNFDDQSLGQDLFHNFQFQM